MLYETANVLHAVLWRNRRALGYPVQMLCVVGIGYTMFTFVNFLRVAWPEVATDGGLGKDDYNYEEGMWVLAPSKSWAEAVTCWWIIFGFMLVIVWADLTLNILPKRMYPNEKFEVIRKIPVLLASTGVSGTAIAALYFVDTEWTTHEHKRFEYWIALPMILTEIANLIFLISVWLYTVRSCPKVSREQHLCMTECSIVN